MAAAFLVTLREGLEAALIIGIILAYLDRTGGRQYFRNIWLGAGLAVMVSLAAGAGLYWTIGHLSGRAEEIFEGTAMFIAVLVLIYMVIWMKRQAVNIKANLEAQVGSAVATGSALTLASLAFIVVVREGIETVLFMLGVLTSATPLGATVGGLLGLALAVGIGYGIYRGASRINLRAFFNVTSLLLILFAAGLLAHGIHEFHEAGVIPPVVEHVWDVNHILAEKTGFGKFLASIFGYNANPSLVEAIAYFSFLGLALAGYFWPGTTKGAGKLSVEAEHARAGSGGLES
ncbi:MAG: iron uptake transporter permease EfeU [Dehalococcoidia bacterium]